MFFDDSKTDLEVIEFMDECFNYVKEHGTKKGQLLRKAIAEFSDDVKKAFLQLFETVVFCEEVKQEAGKLIFTLDEAGSYKWKLILYTDDIGSQGGKFGVLNFQDAQIIKKDNGYRLICREENYEQDTEKIENIFFDKAVTEIDIFRADKRFDSNPWETLSMIAIDILYKEDLGEEYLNQKERELIPLLKVLRGLSELAPLYEEEKSDFEILKRYAQDYRASHLIKLIDKIEECYQESTKRYRLLAKLRYKLNESVCEPLWRRLYELLSDSQEGYEERPSLNSDSKLQEMRAKIQEQLHSLGYEGEYPVFLKTGAMKGIHLEESYNLSYFVGMEKNVKYVIKCMEDNTFEQVQIQFLCGTAFLKKNEEITDIYSLSFNAKGRRLLKTVYFQDEDLEALEQIVTIAAKKAECIRLNKTEKQAYYGKAAFEWQNFILTFLVLGGMFAILMTLAALLFCCLATIVTLGIKEIPDMILHMPWWLFFNIAYIGFGGTMAILNAKAKRK